jgi:hypothetical protein
MSYLELLTRRDILLALGSCLVVVGCVLRGIARFGRRDEALRKQHLLDHGSLGEQADRTERHLEQYLPRYATVAICMGVVVLIVAFLR